MFHFNSGNILYFSPSCFGVSLPLYGDILRTFYSQRPFKRLDPAETRNSHQRCSIRKSVLKNFAKFTGKRLCQSLLLRDLAKTLWNIKDRKLWSNSWRLYSCKALHLRYLREFWPYLSYRIRFLFKNTRANFQLFHIFFNRNFY